MLAHGSTIGIIGGGQLGRMLSMAASHMGYRTHIYTPEKNCPASHVTPLVTIADYDDESALEQFAQAVDLVTFEFENVPPHALERLNNAVTVHPSPNLLRICRHRLREKTMINDAGIQTAPFAPVRSLEELEAAIQTIGTPSVLKTTELGYDGKGQAKINAHEEAASAWATLNSKEAILEGWLSFKPELSIIIARDAQGNTACYDPVENIHRDHILHQTTAPAIIRDSTAREAKTIANTLAQQLNLVGIMAIELFEMEDGTLRVNELAPRPHNSGHWTMDAAATSQFEQHIRAITGHALGDTAALCTAIMHNLIGDDVHQLSDYTTNPRAHLHLYGKTEARAGRKMGHVTITQPNQGDAS